MMRRRFESDGSIRWSGLLLPVGYVVALAGPAKESGVPAGQSVLELGMVAWLGGFDQAAAEAAARLLQD